MPKLVVISEDMNGRTFELTEDKVTVGRLPDNQVCLENSAVSSHHAELIRKGEDYMLHDLNSTNGTRVNGQRIVESRLSHGDNVWFGHLELQYFSTAQGAPKPLPDRRKTVDLSTSKVQKINHKPSTFTDIPRFSTKESPQKSKKILQTILIVGGVIAVLVTLAAIVMILNQ